jgi:hypothetical protein
MVGVKHSVKMYHVLLTMFLSFARFLGMPIFRMCKLQSIMYS